MKARHIAALLLVVLLAGCDALTGQSNIEYRVSGSAARVSLTYESEGGGTSQVDSAAVPWSYSFKAKKGDFLYVSAQIVSTSGGTVTVAIYKGGTQIESSSSSGFASIATASTMLD